MDIKKFYADPTEKPLDHLVEDGGFCRIFRTIGCIGDSLSSGEFESQIENGDRAFHDMYEYSWGQQLARMTGCRAINFSRGGMTAKWFLDSFGEECGCWKAENVCQAYIIALGVNDHLHTKGLPNLVVCFDDIGELKLVSHARTTGGLHSQTKANALAALGQISLNVLGSFFSQRNGHDYFPCF